MEEAYFYIGKIHRFRGKLRHADIAYTTAVKLEPNIALWWYRLGSVREAMRDLAQAASAYERALVQNPEYAEAESGLRRVGDNR